MKDSVSEGFGSSKKALARRADKGRKFGRIEVGLRSELWSRQ